MLTHRLVRWSGLASILLGMIIFFSMLFFIMDVYLRESFLAITIMIIPFTLLGLMGLYVRQGEKIGWLGVVGFLLALIGTVFLEGVLVMARIVSVLGDLMSIKEITRDLFLVILEPFAALEGLLLALYGLAFAPLILGWATLGYATMRGKILPRWGGLLVALGFPLAFVLYWIGNLLVLPRWDIRAFIGVALWAVGYIWLGYALWTDKSQTTTSTEPAM